MENETWIKIFRRFLGWQWFHKSEMVHLFVYLLLKANASDQKRGDVEIKRGQLLTTYREIEEETCISAQTLRTCIARLKSTNEITSKSTNKNTLITICNYERYQGVFLQTNEQTNEQINEQVTNGCTDLCTVTNKNERNINIIISARTREEDFINTLKTEQYWLEVMAKNYGYDLQTLYDLLDKFNTDCQCRGVVHRDLADARQHFNNWLGKRKQSDAAAKRNGRAKNHINDIWR